MSVRPALTCPVVAHGCRDDLARLGWNMISGLLERDGAAAPESISDRTGTLALTRRRKCSVRPVSWQRRLRRRQRW